MSEHEDGNHSKDEMDWFLVQFRKAVVIKDRTHHFVCYRKCFVGFETVTNMVNEGLAKDREHAVTIGNELLSAGFFAHVEKAYDFRDEPLLYRFAEDELALSGSRIGARGLVWLGCDIVPKNASYDLLPLFIDGRFNAYDPYFIQALEYCSTEHLCRNLPLIARAALHTPTHMSEHVRVVVGVLMARCQHEPMLSTVMNCFRQSNCLPDLQLENPVMAMYWSQSKDCGLAAALCRIRNEQGNRFIYCQDDELPIYFPFFAGAAVVEIQVKKLFASNAKPALLLFRLAKSGISSEVSSGPIPLHVVESASSLHTPSHPTPKSSLLSPTCAAPPTPSSQIPQVVPTPTDSPLSDASDTSPLPTPTATPISDTTHITISASPPTTTSTSASTASATPSTSASTTVSTTVSTATSTTTSSTTSATPSSAATSAASTTSASAAPSASVTANPASTSVSVPASTSTTAPSSARESQNEPASGLFPSRLWSGLKNTTSVLGGVLSTPARMVAGAASHATAAVSGAATPALVTTTGEQAAHPGQEMCSFVKSPQPPSPSSSRPANLSLLTQSSSKSLLLETEGSVCSSPQDSPLNSPSRNSMEKDPSVTFHFASGESFVDSLVKSKEKHFIRVGKVYKKGFWNTAWQLRYLALTQDKLEWYADQPSFCRGDKMKSSLDLAADTQCTLEEGSNSQFPCEGKDVLGGFNVQSNSRCYYFCAPNAPAWVAAINSVVKKTLKPPSVGHQFYAILKRGDDPRQDLGVLRLFAVFNVMWARESVCGEFGLPVVALTYNVMPIQVDMELIQFVDNLVPLRHILQYAGQFCERGLHRLITTAAGAFTAAFVLGIRDRHDENIVICKDDGSLFNIDFGNILGDTPSIDTSEFAITNNFKEVVGNLWEPFVDLCVEAFLALRKHFSMVVGLAYVMLSAMHTCADVTSFVRKQLRMDVSEEVAIADLRRLIRPAKRTQAKNVIHAVAQGLK